MQARMKHPVYVFPEALQATQALAAASKKGGVPETTLFLVHLRASQINGCSFCVDMHARELKQAGEPDERLFAVAAWHDSPLFSDAERAAVALTEAATRIADRADAVPDAVWLEAKKHYDEPALASLLLNIGMINFWNHMNVTIRQPSMPHQSAKAA